MTFKKLIRFFLRFVVLVVLVCAAIIVLLETGIAGRYALMAIGNHIGVDLSAESVRVGVGGTIRLRRLEVTLPEEEEPFLTAHRIRIALHSIPELIQHRTLNVSDIRIVSPSLTLRRDAAGQLNIEPLMTAFDNRTRRPKTPGPVRIPAIEITHGSFHYEQSGAAPRELSGIQFSCRTGRDGRLETALGLPGDNHVIADVDLDTLSHQVEIRIQDVAVLSRLLGDFAPPIFQMEAGWTGRLTHRQPWQLEAEAQLKALRLYDIEAVGSVSVNIDKHTLTATLNTGRIDPWATVYGFQTRPDPIVVDSATVRYAFEEARITLDNLKAAMFDGRANIEGTLYPRNPAHSNLTIAAEAFNLSYWLAGTAFEEATLDGSLSLQPARDARAMEPMQVEMALRLGGDVFETAGLEEITSAGYLGRKRLVATDVSIPIFGGTIAPWLNITRRDDGLFVHLIGDFEGLDIDHIVRTLTHETHSVPGRLSGTVRCRTSGDLKTLSGSADVVLTESDLMHTAVVGTLYNAMNLRFGELERKGRGTVKLSAQGERIEIMSFEYFNRGAEIRGSGAIEAITQGKQSPVSGFASGSMRPLSETPIPGMRELDRLIGGLQAGLAAVKVEGTLGTPTARVVPLPEVQNALRALLWQQLRD